MNESLKLGVTVDDTGEYAGFYLPEEDRTTHLYVLGSSGVGKSKGLANWILEDIRSGRGCGVIDPHGDFINDVVGNPESHFSICSSVSPKRGEFPGLSPRSLLRIALDCLKK